MDDAAIASLLAARAECPYPGAWQEPPYARRTVGGATYALVAVDPGLSALGVREDGALWALPDEGEPHLVNSGLEAFVAVTRRYLEAAAEAAAYQGEDGDDTDDAADALTEELIARFREVDAAAVADENAFWCVAAEELGYAMEA